MYCRNSGILIAYILGTYFTYITSSYYFIGMTLIFLVGIWFVPSTPQYHLRKNNLVPAQKSFNFYNKHRLQSDPKFCMVQFDSLRDVANVNTTGPKLSWRDVGEYITLNVCGRPTFVQFSLSFCSFQSIRETGCCKRSFSPF